MKWMWACQIEEVVLTIDPTTRLLALYPDTQDAIAREAKAAFAAESGAPGYDKFSELVSAQFFFSRTSSPQC